MIGFTRVFYFAATACARLGFDPYSRFKISTPSNLELYHHGIKYAVIRGISKILLKSQPRDTSQLPVLLFLLMLMLICRATVISSLCLVRVLHLNK